MESCKGYLAVLILAHLERHFSEWSRVFPFGTFLMESEFLSLHFITSFGSL